MEFFDTKTKSTIHIRESGNAEYVNPIEFWRNLSMNIDISLMKKIMDLNKDFVNTSDTVKERVYRKMAFQNWSKDYEIFINTSVHENLVSLLETTKKSKQEKLLKGLWLNPDNLIPIFFLAWDKYDYTFSNYTFRHFKGVNPNQMPQFAYIEENGELTVIGDTTLKPETIKYAIKNQHRVVARFLDKGNIWHCFFQTMKGVSGEEDGLNPHIHYISSAWNIPRARILQEFAKPKYKLPRLPHINFKSHDIN